MGLAVILFGAFGEAWPIIAASALWGFGYTFTSGAFDAWLADEVGPQRLAGVYLRGAQVGRVHFQGAAMNSQVQVLEGLLQAGPPGQKAFG